MKTPVQAIGTTISLIAEREGLDIAFSSLWEVLEKGAKSSRKPFHYCSLATVNEGVPSQRTMVLQKVTNARQDINRTFRFHADSRSPKVDHVIHASTVANASCLWYEPGHKLQIRANGHLSMASKSETRATWEGEMKRLAKRCYFSPVSPSTAIRSFDELRKNHEKMVNEASSGVAQNFSILDFKVDSLEFLVLGIHGHIRAKQYFEERQVNYTWLSP